MNGTPFSDTSVVSIQAVRGYRVFRGRNAWNFTWSLGGPSYTLYSIRQEAMACAEGWRSQGSVFYIADWPAVEFRTVSETLLVTQLDTDDPLAEYAVRSDPPPGKDLQQLALNNYVRIGAPLDGVELSFNPDSRFWRHPPSRSGLVSRRKPNSECQYDPILGNALQLHKSHPIGRSPALNWFLTEKRDEGPSVQPTAILRLVSESEQELI